jgi:hypothetical protein
MKLGEAKKRAIQLIEEYSVRGTITSDAKNADYLLRMNNLADYAQNEISDRVGIDASFSIDANTAKIAEENYHYKYALPDDFKDMRHVLYRDIPFYEYRIENRQLWVTRWLEPNYTVYYYKYPTAIDDTTSDDYEFEIDPYAQTMIPYYLGGMVIADEENVGLSNKLLNIFYERLAQAHKRLVRYPKTVRLSTRW